MVEGGFPVLAVIGNSAFDRDVVALAETVRHVQTDGRRRQGALDSTALLRIRQRPSG
jgi:hypothetical protein